MGSWRERLVLMSLFWVERTTVRRRVWWEVELERVGEEVGWRVRVVCSPGFSILYSAYGVI